MRSDLSSQHFIIFFTMSGQGWRYCDRICSVMIRHNVCSLLRIAMSCVEKSAGYSFSVGKTEEQNSQPRYSNMEASPSVSLTAATLIHPA